MPRLVWNIPHSPAARALLAVTALWKSRLSRSTIRCFGAACSAGGRRDDPGGRRRFVAIDTGETLGLVGESGCGKTTTARAILHLVRPSGGQRCGSGQGRRAAVPTATRAACCASGGGCNTSSRTRMLSLNPRWTIGETLREPLRVHGMPDRRQLGRARIAELLELVGLRAAACLALSARVLRRAAPARRRSRARWRWSRELLICDEPVSSLDVSVRAQILNLLVELQDRLGLGVSVHLARPELGALHQHACGGDVSRPASSRSAPVDALFARPRHHYTRALLSAIPVPDPAAAAERIHCRARCRARCSAPPGCPLPSALRRGAAGVPRARCRLCWPTRPAMQTACHNPA